MERTVKKDDRISFQKIGRGSLRINLDGKMRIIKPNQIFKAKLDEIPTAFSDIIVRVDGKSISEKEEEKEPVNIPEPEYVVKGRGSGGWYDVLDSEGKAVNDKALKKEDAWDLLKSLTE